METKPHFSILATSFAGGPRPRNAAVILAGLWLLLFFAALFSPPLLDDADATHAQAAQSIALTGNLVTLHVDGIRYLEKAPLPYWLAALSFKLFGFNTFAAHLPQALAVLLLALLGHRWANNAFGSRTAFYTALALLTSVGVFLFTRILIPEVFLSLFLAAALYAFLRTVAPNPASEPHQTRVPHVRGPQRAHFLDGVDVRGPQRAHLLDGVDVRGPQRAHFLDGVDVRGPQRAHLLDGVDVRGPQRAHLLDGVDVSPLRHGSPEPLESRAPHLNSGPTATEAGSLPPNQTSAPTPSSLPSSLFPLPSSPPTPEQPAHLIPLPPALYPYLMWSALALAILSKGLVALIFFAIPTLLYLALTDNLSQLKRLRPVTGLLLFLLIAAPWHILAALQNPATANHPGFFWFYFWNEHVLRFLGRRTPADYNKLPGYLYWLQHLAWLFPWSLFLPLAITALWRRFRHQQRLGSYASPGAPGLASETWDRMPQAAGSKRTFFSNTTSGFQSEFGLLMAIAGSLFLAFALFYFRQPDPFSWIVILSVLALLADLVVNRRRTGLTPSPFHRIDHQQRHILLLSLFAATVLLFFSLSTNQEYYTFPAYLPLLLLLSATITRAEQTYSSSPSSQRCITFAHATLFTLGALISLTLAIGLIASRHISYTPDIGTLLAHRNVGDYTLSTSHLFDLTFPAFAALRLPALMAIVAFTTGPFLAFALRQQRRHLAATTAIAFTSALFLLAAQIAFARFAPVLSSKNFATAIQTLEQTHQISTVSPLAIYGDQAFGSSLLFYLHRPVQLVDGRSTSMLFGSTFEDAPSLFLTPHQLSAQWGRGPRHLLFVPAERRAEVNQLLGPNQFLLKEESGKALLTDRPLNP